MRLVDVRLIRHAHATRTFLVLAVAIGVAQVLLLIGQAALLAWIITRAFQGGSIGDVVGPILLLGLVFAVRGGLLWAAEVVAHRTSAAVKSQLRRLLLGHVVKLGSRWLTKTRSGDVATLATHGIDALDGYFARYLPQLVLAALVPLAIVVQLLGTDWVSALIVVCTVPLIPLFMVLVGTTTKGKVAEQWRTLQALAHHFLDVLSGLGTLAAFGRSRTQVDTIRRMSEQQRKAGQAALRVAFMSSLVLELVATLSVALVAVVVSLRVLHSTLDLRTALFVLILAPEAYLPVRQMATQYHASAEGLGAAEKVFALLDVRPAVESGGTGSPPDPAITPVRLDNVTVIEPDRDVPLIANLSMEIAPGRFTGIVAPTGSGKSTVFAVLTKAVRPDRGQVLVGDVDLQTVDTHAWRRKVGWLAQEPALFAGTVAENIALGHPNAPQDAIAYVADAAVVDVPLDRVVGEHGRGLSSGQRRRVALARALLGNPGLLLLDEPTESVDSETEAAVFDALRHGLQGRTVVVVTHRPALLQLCHHVIHLDRQVQRPAGHPVAGREVPA